MKDLDIIDDYKQPSDKEIEQSQNFSELMSRYNASHAKGGKSNNKIKFFGGAILLVSIVSILSYYALIKYDNHSEASLKIEQKETVLPLSKDSIVEQSTFTQRNDTVMKPVQDHNISLKEKSSKNGSHSFDTKQLNLKDTIYDPVSLKSDVHLKTDSVIEPVKNKVKVKNGNQTIYEQDQQELEKKLMERYYHKKK